MLAFSNDYYGIIFRATQSVELFCAYKKSSTIFCSQYVFGEWYDQLGGEASPLADAIIDRIAHNSYQINITSIDAKHDKSMREIYGLDKTLRE